MDAGSEVMSCLRCISPDTVATATAEWYRSLAEWGLSPRDHIPYFTTDWPPVGCTPLNTSTVESIPPPPRGMTT